MKQVKHPFTNDKPVLTEQYTNLGIWHFNVERTARYRRAGTPYVVRELFATVRPAVNSGGLWDIPTKGVVVLRNNFDEIREFPDFFTAKQYIEALFALEHAAG